MAFEIDYKIKKQKGGPGAKAKDMKNSQFVDDIILPGYDTKKNAQKKHA